MAKLTTEKRERLKCQQYACPRDRKLPINDAAHVRNAMARFNQVESKFCHPATARRGKSHRSEEVRNRCERVQQEEGFQEHQQRRIAVPMQRRRICEASSTPYF